MTLGDMCASVRHVWDMHRPQDIQASMRASVRPVWDTTSASIYESQCKTCLRHGIDFDVLGSTHGRVPRLCVTHGEPNGRVVRPCVPYTSNLQVSVHGSKHTGRDTTVCLSCVENMAPGHGRVPWPCVPNWLIKSETKCQGFYTRAATQACHGYVRDTCYRHRRVPGRVKTLRGSSLEFNSHGFGARACSFVLRPCEPQGP
ncbi:Zinc finger and BTB domain-containing 7C [Gossypium arboreum]|uniref:Zinc finger and BTB domain-containing 7C n=1 Tax=Gossypium arboreum TaxID=29729 RepID=A0A0B0MMY3_GOSAR|nr:Zinc finger and BTB domain-containing 7C [Gossypium arboreum]